MTNPQTDWQTLKNFEDPKIALSIHTMDKAIFKYIVCVELKVVLAFVTIKISSL